MKRLDQKIQYNFVSVKADCKMITVIQNNHINPNWEPNFSKGKSCVKPLTNNRTFPEEPTQHQREQQEQQLQQQQQQDPENCKICQNNKSTRFVMDHEPGIWLRT